MFHFYSGHQVLELQTNVVDFSVEERGRVNKDHIWVYAVLQLPVRKKVLMFDN